MNTLDLKKELPAKQRSIDDLYRYIITRTDMNPNYCLLLGAGCSVTSGVMSAKELISIWRREIYESYEDNKNNVYDPNEAINYLSSKHGNWYNVTNEYSSLFEKKYDLPKQRRMFVERGVSDKLPSIGYSYLTALIKQTYFNTIFTTNFDDIINEAFYQFSDTRPIICAHDSSIKSITITSKRPKIIKLHGDYLFDDIKSTLRETESLEDNIRNKLIEFMKDYGLIVVGYSGYDRSIMDVLTYLLKQEDYLKNGIYWCIKKNDTISEELRKILWKDRVYYVEIDGFDELFAYIYERMHGNRLPIDTNFVSDKAQNIIKGFLENKHLVDTQSAKITSDLKELKNNSEKNHYFNVIKQFVKYGNKENIDSGFNDKEMVALIEIKNKIDQKHFGDAIKHAKNSLDVSDDKKYKIELYELIIQSLVYLDKNEEAVLYYNKIIDIDQRSPAHMLDKADIVTDYIEKMSLIDAALDKDKYYFRPYHEKATLLIEMYNKNYESNLFDQIIVLLDTGIKRYPSIRNPCWETKFNFYSSSTISKKDKIAELTKLINCLSEQGIYYSKLLSMKSVLLYFDDYDREKINNHLKEINTAKEKMPENISATYDILYLKALDKFNLKAELEEKMTIMDSNASYSSNIEYLKTKANILFRKFGRLEDAIKVSEKVLDFENDTEVICKLIKQYLYSDQPDKADNLLIKYGCYLTRIERHIAKMNIYEAKNKYDLALNEVDKINDLNKNNNVYAIYASFLYLQLNNYTKAHDVCKNILTEINFNTKASCEIINYELSKTMLNKEYKINKPRLQSVYDMTDCELTKAAVKVLYGDIDAAFKHINDELLNDLSSKYAIRNWPVFKQIHKDTRWQQIYT